MTDFKGICNFLETRKFYLTLHPVVLHHLRKDFKDYDVVHDRFFIMPIGRDFIHVAVIEHDVGREQNEVFVRYTLAGDDLLYGLRVKFNSGGDNDPNVTLQEIYSLTCLNSLRNQPRYVRNRFRHGRFQAKFRATLVYLRDQWRALFPLASST